MTTMTTFGIVLICLVLLVVYGCILYGIAKSLRLLQNKGGFDSAVGFGKIQHESNEIAHLLTQQIRDFASTANSVLDFQKKVRQFCLSQSEQIQSRSAKLSQSVHALIDLGDAMEQAQTQSDPNNKALASLKRRFEKEIEELGLMPIRPESGSGYNPHQQKIVGTFHSEFPKDSIIQVVRAGYEFQFSGEKWLIRPAEVTLSLGPEPQAAPVPEKISTSSSNDQQEAQPELGIENFSSRIYRILNYFRDLWKSIVAAIGFAPAATSEKMPQNCDKKMETSEKKQSVADEKSDKSNDILIEETKNK